MVVTFYFTTRHSEFNPLTMATRGRQRVKLQSILCVSERVKPSFVIFGIRTLWRSALSVRVPGCQKLKMTA